MSGTAKVPAQVLGARGLHKHANVSMCVGQTNCLVGISGGNTGIPSRVHVFLSSTLADDCRSLPVIADAGVNDVISAGARNAPGTHLSQEEDPSFPTRILSKTEETVWVFTPAPPMNQSVEPGSGGQAPPPAFCFLAWLSHPVIPDPEPGQTRHRSPGRSL